MTAIEWRETPLGDIVNIHRGITWKREQEAKSKGENTIPVLRIPNIKQILDTSDLLFIRGVTESHRAKYAATKNWILMVGSNGNPERVGNCVFIDEDNEYLFASFLLGIESKDCEQVDPKYLFRLIGGPLIQRSISDAVQGSTGLKNISLKMLRQEFVKIPPLPEQKKIAAILSSVDNAIQATQAVIDQTRRVKQGLMQQLLTRGIGHTRFKQTEIGEIPEEWCIKTAKEVCSKISVGIVVKPTQYYESNGIKCFRSANVREGYIKDQDWVYISEEANNLNAKSKLQSADVLIVRTGYPGTSCVVPQEYEGTNCIDILFARPKVEIILSHYLSCFINSSLGKKQVLYGQGGLAQKHFNVNALNQMKIVLPSIYEQKKITTILTNMDNVLNIELDKMVQIQKIKRGLMQDLLTGRVRVKLDEMNTT